VCGVLVAACSMSAMAQTDTDPATKFSGFLCGIDLKASRDASGITLDTYVSPTIEGNVVYTFTSNKLCTGSKLNANENIKIDCLASIPGWRPGLSINTKDVSCTVSGAACGLPGILTAINNNLTIDGAGKATLTCQVK
jgi:hypothetical protein